MCIKYCPSGLYYQLQGSCWNVGNCKLVGKLVFTSNKATVLLPTTRTGQHKPFQGSCCPVWDMQNAFRWSLTYSGLNFGLHGNMKVKADATYSCLCVDYYTGRCCLFSFHLLTKRGHQQHCHPWGNWHGEIRDHWEDRVHIRTEVPDFGERVTCLYIHAITSVVVNYTPCSYILRYTYCPPIYSPCKIGTYYGSQLYIMYSYMYILL